MENVTDVVADARVIEMEGCDLGETFAFHHIPCTKVPNYRLATPSDELHLLTAFSKMLRELEPLGHDILPTEHNIELFYDHYFLPALTTGEHGIALAFLDDECVGAVFMAPDQTPIDTPPNRAIDWGCYVAPKHRRQGIATGLRELALRTLKRAGTTQVVTNILTANQAGLASYTFTKAKCLAHTYTINLEEMN